MNLTLKIDCEFRIIRGSEMHGGYISPLTRNSDTLHKPRNSAIFLSEVPIPLNYVFKTMLHLNNNEQYT